METNANNFNIEKNQDKIKLYLCKKKKICIQNLIHERGAKFNQIRVM